MKFCAEKVQKTKNFAQILQNFKNFYKKFNIHLYKNPNVIARSNSDMAISSSSSSLIKKRNKNETTNKRINYLQSKRYERQN